MVGPKRRTSLVFAVLMLSTTRSFIASAFSNVQNAGFLGRGGGQIPGRVFRTAEQRRGLVRTPSRAPPTKELLVTSPDEDTTVSTYNMEDIVNVCKRRGFVFQSSEIYNGFNGFYDYGPLGVELKNNIKQRWWRDMVHSRDDMVGLDSSIIASPRVWEASGHVAGFVDPMVDCRVSKLRYRADQLYFTKVELQEDGEVIGYIALLDSGDLHGEARKLAEKLKKKAGKEGTIKFPLDIKDMTKATVAEMALIPSPATGEPGSLTPPRAFNLMFQTSVGALADASSTAFLRPETAQGIFTNFKNVQSTGRVKVPFGIAQIGKAFRNEITPRNFIFRSREFEQMEIEYFIPPEEEVWPDFYNKWIETAWQWLTSIGMREDLMGRDVHLKGDLAHYAKACTDIVFRFPFGQVELQGIAARGDYDLTQHQTSSGKSMEYFDEANKRRYVPHVIEPSIGVDRLFLALICSAYAEDEIEGEKRVVLKFHPSMAPIKVGVFPLVKNKPEIMEKARAIYDQLKRRYNVFWDVSGAIGRRYRRMDEAGTPFCITVDFDTLEDDSVTVRERDSTRQTRMKVDDLLAFFDKEING
ncbi:glycyl-trna synthetase [Nannochloropsis gaditana]|uniref:glycine--tRNA ligase n=1 Tax=Nannochloropsis gaditana TaxID=72520 RepID=W7TM99_9STRA|nr:glycyl-trna synthetase [Nannochloropsis gaditana]